MNEFDLRAQSLNPAATLIEASAGTGKTYNIQHLYLRFIVDKGLTPERVLVVTFSNEATAELKLRITRNLSCAEELLLSGFPSGVSGEDVAGYDGALVGILEDALNTNEYSEVLRRVQFAVRAMDEAAILTIHGFCLSLLTDYAFESGSLFGVELVEDRKELFDDLLSDFVRKQVAYRDDTEGVLLREYLKLETMRSIPGLVYGRDDVVVLDGDEDLPDIKGLYRQLLFENFEVLRAELKKKRGTKAYVILDYLQEHSEVSDSVAIDFIKLVNSKEVDYIVKRSKYFYTVFHQEFQDVILELRMIPEKVSRRGCLMFIEYLSNYFAESNNPEEKSRLVFDDLLYLTRSAVKRNDRALLSRVRDAYGAVMVDEFQDTSGVQYDIFNSLFGGGAVPFFMIGDPKQSIYAFRDADIFSYLKAVKSPDVGRATLSHNFRSTPEYIAAMNLLFENRVSQDNYPLPFLFEDISYIHISAGRTDERRLVTPDSASALEFRWRDDGEVVSAASAEREIVIAVADDIVRKLNDAEAGRAYFSDSSGRSGLRPSDFAVLVDRNSQGELIRDELNRRGIVGVLLKTGSVLDSFEAEELALLLNAMVNSGNERAVMAALSTRCFEYSLSDLSEYRMNEDRVLDYWAEFFGELEGVIGDAGFLSAFSTLFQREHVAVEHPAVKVVLAGSENGERAVTNYLQLVEILAHELLDSNESETNVYNILQSLRLKDSKSEEYEMRLESDEDAVKIMTIHKSKGLQFPVVYVPFLYRPVKAKSSFKNPETCHLDDGKIGVILSQSEMNEFSGRLELEERAERMRLLYVALTRAIDRCIVFGGNIKSVESSALADILDQDFSRLGELNASEYISVIDGWGNSGGVYRPAQTAGRLVCPEFEGRIEQDWGVMSYSSLVSHDFVSIDDRSDAGISGESDEEVMLLDGVDNLYPLPSSNTVGSAVHEIIEEFDFGAYRDGFDSEGIYQKLKKFGVIGSDVSIDATGLQLNAVEGLLTLLSSLPLSDFTGRNFALSEIGKGELIPEMSFYFPVRRKISAERLQRFFRERGLESYREVDEFDEVLSEIGISLQRKGFREGFLFGLIDLVFEKDGCYYFADWKTNDLKRYGGYTQSCVLRSMGESGYLLQFYIYTVALNLFLRSRITDFDYERHFGGGYYLYLRGLRSDNPSSGVFYEKPSEEDVNELIDIFTGGNV